jgi:glycosidase
MAMLMTNRIFASTWGEKAGQVPEKEFWEEVIFTVKNKFPNFKFIAEVYWDMEWELQQQGFDFCYDKRLYDRLVHENAKAITEHLKGDIDYQHKLVRFIENHDEFRSISTFGKERSQAAAIIALSLPGARLIYEGQMQGYRIKLPVQLGRREIEEGDPDLLKFYQILLKVIPSKDFEEGNWGLCNLESVIENDSLYTNLISYLWWEDNKYILIAVNYSPYRLKAHVRIEQIKYGLNDWVFTDLLTGENFKYNGEDLDEYGLFIDLPSWNGHIFNIQEIL